MQVVRGFGMRAYDMQAEDHPQGHIWVASKVPCSPVVAVDVSDNVAGFAPGSISRPVQSWCTESRI